MSDSFWPRLSFLTGLIAIGVLFGLVAFCSSIEIKDLDLWLHLGTGRYINANGYVPAHDILSATIAGKSWINHEWLFQLIVYHVHRLFGFDGLISMQTIVVALTFMVLLFMCYSRRSQLPIVLSLILVLLVYQTRFTIRPDIFSVLFFVLFIYILSSQLHRRWAIYVLIVLQVLWANMHGFFFFGPVLAAIGVVAEWIKRTIKLPAQWNEAGRLSDDEYKRMKFAVLILSAVTMINPLGIQGALYPLGVLFQLGGDSKIFFNHINELKKPITEATIWTTTYFHYKVLIIISAYSFIINRRKIDIGVLMIWLVFLLFSLAALRNLIFFAVVGYLVFMINISQVKVSDILPFRFSDDKFKAITGIAFKIFLSFWMINLGIEISSNGYFDYDSFERKSEFWGVSKRAYPDKALDFIVRNNIKGNFFNDFNSGAYIVGRAHPNVKVFIDGRTEVYGAAFFEMYRNLWNTGDRKVFDELARKYNLTGALLNSAGQEIPPKTAKMFYEMKDWSVVYFDYDGLVLLKQTPQNKPIIDRFAIDLSKWEPKPFNLYKLGPRRIDPFVFTNRAYTLIALGLLEPAKKEALQALLVAPEWLASYRILGKIYGQQKDHRKAFEYLRIAVMFAPQDIEARSNLALAYEHLRYYKGALAQYQRMIEYAPHDPKGYFGVAKEYALAGQSLKAIEALKVAMKMDAKDKIDVKKIHDIIAKHKLSDELKKKLEDVAKPSIPTNSVK